MSSSSSFLLRLFFDVLFFGLLFFVGFSCSCNAGFKEVADVEVHDPKHQCEDINECLDGDYEHGCDANAACTNHVGSANTCECNEGFFGDGAACQSWTMCGANGHETVAPTTTSDGQCACDAHYDGDGVVCHNINDCASEPCQNGGTCQDGLGTHSCTCVGGFTGDDCETCSPANAQPTVSGSATNIRVHWQGEVSAWNDRPYRASDLGVFTQSNFEYEVQTSVNHRRDGYVVTPAFDATVVIVSENRWDLTAPRFAHLEECPEAWKVTSAGNRAHAPNQSGQSGFIKYNLYGHRSVSAWTFAMNYCYKSDVSAGTPVSVPAAEVNGGRYDVEKTLTFVKSQCGTVTV